MAKRVSLDYIDNILSSLSQGTPNGAGIHGKRNLAQKIQFDKEAYEDAIRSGNSYKIDECSKTIEESTGEAVSFLSRIFGNKR